MRPVSVWLLLCLCSLAACSSVPQEGVLATPLLSLASYSTEAAQVQLTARADQQNMAATVQVARQVEQQQSAYNAVLLATVRADQVPTPEERLAMTDGGAMMSEMFSLNDDKMRVQQIGLAGFVRPEDDCFETHQQYYNRTITSIIYMTGLVTNLQEGTRFSVDWIYDNNIVYSASWSAPRSETIRCLAIPMRASDVVFNEGGWSARLFMDGVPIGNSAFQILN